ncbi:MULTISPECIES: hypothetical protein [Pseudoalteromonas]|uniref:Uncharacterized protein n=2 Tax=Pseudoalteromonas TaxID=53246 RepID=V4I425_PSEL2|nr:MULTISPECIES: hypothetical protein [Pseudoalteromonas]ESP94994.1 hypothetical protein PL2TA16_04550 [Pseudoalteromonas luteoviolacea 2ta16]KZN36324.1 hypothetical protein N483_22700 [Pseudoalteromonas luteoviolacea NCIMB 1944]MBQ4836534.1 hypothetical protein [Pseudoalteromonas luteoviolacea]MCG7550121.1 hypothetical protein [Pseudoalteromonas sp. Of7M-16]MDK2593476.1 hypothetical protein [Pseudoalteromonas sp. P94(2023)]
MKVAIILLSSLLALSSINANAAMGFDEFFELSRSKWFEPCMFQSTLSFSEYLALLVADGAITPEVVPYALSNGYVPETAWPFAPEIVVDICKARSRNFASLD